MRASFGDFRILFQFLADDSSLELLDTFVSRQKYNIQNHNYLIFTFQKLMFIETSFNNFL